MVLCYPGTMLGDARSDLIDTLAVVLGRPKAEKQLTDLEELVRAKASEGASAAATPIVQKGLMIGAGIAIGGVVLGLILARRSARRRLAGLGSACRPCRR